MAVLVSAAVAGVLHLQAGWSLVFSVFAGLVTLGVSLLANTLAARNAETGRLRLEIARLELELARLKTQNLPNRPSQGELDTGVLVSKAALPAEARWDVAAARRSRGAPANGVPTGSPAGQLTAQGPQQSSETTSAQQAVDARPQQSSAQKVPAAAEAPRAVQAPASPRQGQAQRDDVPAWAAPSAEQGDALRADWENALNAEAAAPAHQAAPVAERPEAPRMPPMRSVESDLELVQRKIKALADEVNANDAARHAQAHDTAQPAIDESVSALRTAAERMKPRKGFSARPNYAEMTQAPAPQPPQPQQREVMQQRESAPRPQPAPAATRPAMQSPPPARQAHQPQSQPAPAQPAASFGTGPGAPGELPSLDALIPSTAQPIAVSRPASEPQATGGGTGEPQTIAAMPAARSAQARATESPRMDHVMREPARAPEPPRHTYVPEPAKPQTPPTSSYEPQPPAGFEADRRAAPGRRQQDLRLAEIASALEQRRMDVFLNPIVGLGDYAVTHFEVDVRLRADTGGYIEDGEKTLRLHATDMLALFDIERLERTALVAEQLEARGKHGAVLSPTTGHSMADGDFLEAFARTFEARTAISGQLVLTFTQADVAAFGPATWQALADMASFGFRFALQDVTHLSMDFAALAERGFAFVKLPASAFLDGLPAGHGLVPPADICRHLAGSGLTLVVESIDDDQLLGRVFGFGALFGQGTLFGGSRQITLDALGPKRAA